MSLQEWAEANGLSAVYQEYEADREAIEAECVAEGYPGRGANYELRVEQLRESYPELFAADEE